MDNTRVTMSHLNFLRVTNLFYCTDLTAPIKLSTAQALASYASRYAVICAHMRPFITALHRNTSTFFHSNQKRRIMTQLAQFDVLIWRAFLCLIQLNPLRFARSFSSFEELLLHTVRRFISWHSSRSLPNARHNRQSAARANCVHSVAEPLPTRRWLLLSEYLRVHSSVNRPPVTSSFRTT
jgi:hypothetical protein